MQDLISRQAAIDAILKINDYNNSDRANALGLAEFAITTLPSAQPATNCSEFPNNSDTISREAVADAINGIECTRHTTWYEFYQKVMTAVEKLPSAQPDIVRCKDCKHWDGVDTCDVIDAPVWDNDFCSMAERRTDG